MELQVGSKSSTPAPEGTHLATCISIIDYGTQISEKYGKRRILNFGFELAEETTEEGEPIKAYRRYNAVISPKSSLGKDINAWLGKKLEKGENFNVEELLGKSCQVIISHNDGEDGNTYANITAVTGVPKGVKVKKPVSTITSLFLEEGEFDQDIFDELPDWQQEIIKTSDEYKAVTAGKKGKTAAAAPAKGKGGKKEKAPF